MTCINCGLNTAVYFFMPKKMCIRDSTIARKYDLGLSPATIRNEMSDLELLGYLEQPHTSAGRIPSAQAYRFYVDALIEPGTLTDNDMALIDGWYNERRRNIDDIFQSTAKILSRMTQNVSMVLTNQQTIANFCYLKFLPLDSQDVYKRQIYNSS